MDIRKKLFWLGLLAFSFSAFSVLCLDQPLALWLKAVNVGQYYRIYRTLTDAGEAVFYFTFSALGLAGAWLTLRFFPNLSPRMQKHFQTWKERSLFLLASLLASGVLLHILKMIFGRQRPHRTDSFEAHVFHPFNLDWHFHSMPSGHSQTLLTVATFFWITYPKSAWIVFPLALFLSFTRLAMQAHFLSDVTVGAYVGLAVTLIVARKMKRI
ncbi:MAG: phosphatase PAP2 family protein [Pseudobdellovibrionaceae bacterium]